MISFNLLTSSRLKCFNSGLVRYVFTFTGAPRSVLTEGTEDSCAASVGDVVLEGKAPFFFDADGFEVDFFVVFLTLFFTDLAVLTVLVADGIAVFVFLEVLEATAFFLVTFFATETYP